MGISVSNAKQTKKIKQSKKINGEQNTSKQVQRIRKEMKSYKQKTNDEKQKKQKGFNRQMQQMVRPQVCKQTSSLQSVLKNTNRHNSNIKKHLSRQNQLKIPKINQPLELSP